MPARDASRAARNEFGSKQRGVEAAIGRHVVVVVPEVASRS